MNRAVLSRLLVLTFPFLVLTGQDVPIPGTVPPPRAQTVPKPKVKPKPADPAQAPVAQVSLTPFEEPAEVVSEGSPSPAPADLNLAPAALPSKVLPRTFDLGRRCVGFTTHLQEGGRIHAWIATLAPLAAGSLEAQQAILMGRIPEELVPHSRFYKITGNNCFKPDRGLFEAGILAVGPGFVTWLLGNESRAGDRLPSPAGESLRFAFKTLTVSLWPGRLPKAEPRLMALGFHHGSLATRAGGAKGSLVPFATDGILTVAVTGHEVTGLFKFPLAEVAIPMKGVRHDDELWLEAPHPELISLLYQAGVPELLPGITQLDKPRTLRIKVRTELPRRMELCFIPARGEEAFQASGEFKEGSALSLTVLDAAVVDLPGLRESFARNRATPNWATSDGWDGFLRQADMAYHAAGLAAGVWDFAFNKKTLEIPSKAWKEERSKLLSKALGLEVKVDTEKMAD